MSALAGTDTKQIQRDRPSEEVLAWAVVGLGTMANISREIGLLGNSGRSTGPHLHYEVIEDGKSVNPLYYILNAY
jgi:hypothetical protein